MADVFSREKRSEVMSLVKSKGNRATEIRLIGIFRSRGITGWRRHARIFGSPDFVFRRERLAVFVDGCFWHGCPFHGSVPVTNRPFWVRKIERNKERDRVVRRTLTGAGWRVIRIWQHELRESDRIARRLRRSMAGASTKAGTGNGKKQKSRSS